ncbi:hypothetical protein ACJJTC_008669 [Scirpophaga incertulas]
MWYQALMLLRIIITVHCHTPANNSDVIISYSGHSEVEFPLVPKPIEPDSTTVPEVPTNYDQDKDVVFVPNDAPNKDVIRNERMNIENILSNNIKKTVSDLIQEKDIRIENEPPKQDILFIQGRNNENEHVENKKTPEVKQKKPRTTTAKTLDCSKLDCSNNLGEVCGGKIEHKQWRYRLFLNECFFRKVNCNFRYEENRFQLMPIEKCKSVGAHYNIPPIVRKSFQPRPSDKHPPSTAPSVNRRQAFVSRRSLSIDLNGAFCSHPCPISCPEQYEPECAVSNSGVRKVFANHCKLDFNSCLHGGVWYRRPLADCVGGKKADLTQNSAFIGWMQKVGIVDNKGRLNLN